MKYEKLVEQRGGEGEDSIEKNNKKPVKIGVLFFYFNNDNIINY